MGAEQNPSPLSSKVSNFAEMRAALSRLDPFDVARVPSFEPRRGAVVPSYVAAAKAPLIYIPIRGGPESVVRQWLMALDGVESDGLRTKMNQRELRKWKRNRVGHRSFTVLRHPVARIHAAFCERILSTGEGSYPQIRQALKKRHKVPLPQSVTNSGYDKAAHRDTFWAFLEFVRGNLAGQTAVRVDPAWATQAEVVQGFGEFTLPDVILREDTLATDLTALAARVGYSDAPRIEPSAFHGVHALEDIYDDEIEATGADVYQRDYMMFGFDRWQ